MKRVLPANTMNNNTTFFTLKYIIRKPRTDEFMAQIAKVKRF